MRVTGVNRARELTLQMNRIRTLNALLEARYLPLTSFFFAAMLVRLVTCLDAILLYRTVDRNLRLIHPYI